MIACDIVIPVFNQRKVTERCLASVFLHARKGDSVILVDDGSGAETAEYLFAISKSRNSIPVRLIRFETNRGYLLAANAGLRAAQAPAVCLLNNDTVVTEGWLDKLCGALEKDERIGIAAPQSTTYGIHPKAGESIESVSRRLNSECSGQQIETAHCHGFCVVIRKTVMDKIGFLDEVYGRGYFEDQDFTRKVLCAHYCAVIVRDAYVWHQEHATFKKEDREVLFEKNRVIYEKTWGKSKRILWAVTSKKNVPELLKIRDSALESVRSGNWVWIVMPCGTAQLDGLAQVHANIRIFPVPGFWVTGYAFYLWMKRRKKPFQEFRRYRK